MAETLVIANPASANGRVGRRWKTIERALAPRLPGDRTIAFTKGPRDAEEIVRRALREGTKLVVAVGGDGLFNEVVNGFFDCGEPVGQGARLAIVPVGTGSDLRRTLEVPAEVEGAARCIARGRERAVDLGRVTFRAPNGTEAKRYFVNIAEFGSGAEVVEKANRTTKAFGGRLSFLWAILTTMPKHKNTRVRFRAEEREGDVVVNNFIVANARHFGGGLTPAPHAEMDDGLLDVVIIGDIDFAEVRKNLGRLRRGTHLSHPAIQHFRTAALETDCVDPALLDTDGELCGSNPVRFEVVPKALRMVV